MNNPRGPGVRLLALAPAGLAVAAGLLGAVGLLGLPYPTGLDRLPDLHGGLLVLGGIGTLVAVERAVALRRPAGWLAPAVLGAGSVALLLPVPGGLGRGLLTAGMIGLLLLHGALWRRQASRALAIQILGVTTGAGAALLWWGATPVPTALPWFVTFLVLTVVGERVELTALSVGTGDRADDPEAPAVRALRLAVLVVTATVAATLWPGVGHHLLGLATTALVLHMVVHDVARRTARAVGLQRYVAWSLLAGYGWLLVAGGVWAVLGAPGGSAYDALVHAVFLGFVMSMIMAHAPIILPAVLRVPLPYRPVMWVPLGLLHASLALRVVVGDAQGQAWALQLGGALNIAAVVLFAALAVGSATLARVRGADGARRPEPTVPRDRRPARSGAGP